MPCLSEAVSFAPGDRSGAVVCSGTRVGVGFSVVMFPRLVLLVVRVVWPPLLSVVGERVSVGGWVVVCVSGELGASFIFKEP